MSKGEFSTLCLAKDPPKNGWISPSKSLLQDPKEIPKPQGVNSESTPGVGWWHLVPTHGEFYDEVASDSQRPQRSLVAASRVGTFRVLPAVTGALRSGFGLHIP